MATNYPGSLDTGTEQPSPLSTTEMDDAGFEHDVVHTNHSEAIIALETKVGTGSSSAVADSVLAGTGSGTSSWSTAPSLAGLTVDTDTLYVDATNNRVGIGTTSPSHPLHVTGSDNRPIRAESSVSGSYIDIQDSATSGEGYVAVGAVGDEARFIAGGSTRMTIGSGGNVGIGTTSPAATLDVAATGADAVHLHGQVRIDGADPSRLTIGAKDSSNLWNLDNNNGTLRIFREDWAASGTGSSGSTKITITDDGDVAFDTNTLFVDATNNRVGIGTTTPVAPLHVVGNIYNSGVIESDGTYTNTTGASANMHVSSGGFFFRSTSSGKYKTDVETMEDSYADSILGLRPVWYRSLSEHDPDSWGYWGFIAEEVAEVDPRLVSFGVPDDYEWQYDEEGQKLAPDVADLTEPEGVQYDRMAPHLINLLARQRDQIVDLSSRVAALEAA